MISIAFVIAVLIVPVLWLEDRRRRQAIDLLRDFMARGEEIPPKLLSEAFSRPSLLGASDANRWLPPILFGSIAIGFVLGAFFMAESLDNAKVLLGIAVGFVIATIASAALAAFGFKDRK